MTTFTWVFGVLVGYLTACLLPLMESAFGGAVLALSMAATMELVRRPLFRGLSRLCLGD